MPLTERPRFNQYQKAYDVGILNCRPQVLSFESQLSVIDSEYGMFRKKVNFATCLPGNFLYQSKQGPLTMDISLPVFSFLVWPLVVKVVSVARIIEIFCITRYQMKDMDILFPLVPYD